MHLALEDYHNAGLTTEETRAEIERCLHNQQYVEAGGINGNWNIRHAPEFVFGQSALAGRIDIALRELIVAKRLLQNTPTTTNPSPDTTPTPKTPPAQS